MKKEENCDAGNTNKWGDRDIHALQVAIEGCAHGELDSIYNEVRRHEQITGETVDLLLICGDVQVPILTSITTEI